MFFTMLIPPKSIPGENGHILARCAARAPGQNQFWPAQPRAIPAKDGHAWQEVRYDPESQEIPPGCTFGYNVHKRPQADRLLRLDKVHVFARLQESLAMAYTVFVAEAYHKAVVADLAPPVFVLVHPHPPPDGNVLWDSSNHQDL